MQKELQERFDYKDGHLYYKVKVRGHQVGDVAGYIGKNEGGMPRRCITFKGKRYRHARIVWEYHFGTIPEGLSIDHINRNSLDDRIENLRLATQRQQTHNRGCTGCYFNKTKRRWIARIVRDGKTHYLGSFKVKEEAVQARRKAESEMLGLCS